MGSFSRLSLLVLGLYILFFSALVTSEGVPGPIPETTPPAAYRTAAPAPATTPAPLHKPVGQRGLFSDLKSDAEGVKSDVESDYSDVKSDATDAFSSAVSDLGPIASDIVDIGNYTYQDLEKIKSDWDYTIPGTNCTIVKCSVRLGMVITSCVLSLLEVVGVFGCFMEVSNEMRNTLNLSTLRLIF